LAQFDLGGGVKSRVLGRVHIGQFLGAVRVDELDRHRGSLPPGDLLGDSDDLVKGRAFAVGGGGGGKGDIATAGGKNPEGLDEALRLAAEAAGR